MRQIEPRGLWRGYKEGWEFPLEAAEPLKDLLGSRFSIEAELVTWMNYLQYPLPPTFNNKKFFKASKLKTHLLDGREILSHQVLGARWLLKRQGAILADEMGLGKTLTSLLAAKELLKLNNFDLMVIAPVGLHFHWRKEANSLGLDIDLYSWSKIPCEFPLKAKLLIVDEAHFAKSLNSKRTNALLKLSRHPMIRTTWLLTGTPIKNGSPIELLPLLAIIDHPLARDLNSFKKYLTKEYFIDKSKNTELNRSNNLEEFKRIVNPFILHRRKKDILDLPPKTRLHHNVELNEVELLGFNHRISLIVEDYRERVSQGLVCSEAEALSMLSAIRQISSEFKLPSVGQLLKQLLLEDQSVLIFSSFVEPLILLKNSFGGKLLTGRQTILDREKAVDDFQSKQISLLFSTYSVGAFGYTLHQARHIILIDRPWTPGEVEQAEDRCHRIGSEGYLFSHWFKFGFSDQLVDNLLKIKSKKVNDFLKSPSIDSYQEKLSKKFITYLNSI